MLDYKAFLPLADQLVEASRRYIAPHIPNNLCELNKEWPYTRKYCWKSKLAFRQPSKKDYYLIARLVSYKPKKRNNSKQLNKVFKTIVSMRTL